MDILFLGDSLIEYFDWQERFPAHHVANLGVAGESVEGLLSRVVKVADIFPHADIIFIMSGINNVAMGDMEFGNFYRMIIEKLSDKYPGAVIYVHSLLPTIVDFIHDESIGKANNILQELAEETGAEFLNIYERFVHAGSKPVKEYLLDDGVHVSRTGYAVWARAVEEVIERHSLK
jgi:lysophospholipase L1-like esterase